MSTIKKPTPKLAPTGIRSRARWYSFYAMFSESFTRATLEREAVRKDTVVLDPWLGSGTTTRIAAELGLQSIGFDINPTMVQISAGRVAHRERAFEALSQLESIRPRTIPSIGRGDPLLGWFAPATARAFRFWQREIANMDATDDEGSTAGFLNTALFECAKLLARSYRSRNPTWLKKPAADDRIAISSSEVRAAFLKGAERRVPLCRDLELPFTPQIETGDSRRLPLRESTVDLVLTSPPYCTRIDYAVTTSLELAILGMSELGIRKLRDETMGTSTICERTSVSSDVFGETCNRFLTQVEGHTSKASKSYYLKNYLQYFSDLHESILEIHRCVRPGGTVVVVVQDSVYKGLHLDLARIIEEMSSKHGWPLVSRDDFSALRNMRSINTRSRRYLDDRTATESALTFRTK